MVEVMREVAEALVESTGSVAALHAYQFVAAEKILNDGVGEQVFAEDDVRGRTSVVEKQVLEEKCIESDVAMIGNIQIGFVGT